MSTKKLIAVQLSVFAMVWAETSDEALAIAKEDSNRIWSDAPDPTIAIQKYNVQLNQLDSFGWDERCIPYGHDGNTTIKELLS